MTLIALCKCGSWRLNEEENTIEGELIVALLSSLKFSAFDSRLSKGRPESIDEYKLSINFLLSGRGERGEEVRLREEELALWVASLRTLIILSTLPFSSHNFKNCSLESQAVAPRIETLLTA